jgi:diguanylate cyclase (GGDEF)-like protein
VDPIVLDTAAVLAAHVAASLDAAFALGRERLSAATDPLTGILNRRGLEERMERALSHAQEQRVPLSVLVIDCDDFKEINDRAGHEFGDALLREVADVLLRALPDGADAARLGGDEFVVMLPAAGADAAEALGAQIRTRLAEGLTDAGSRSASQPACPPTPSTERRRPRCCAPEIRRCMPRRHLERIGSPRFATSQSERTAFRSVTRRAR